MTSGHFCGQPDSYTVYFAARFNRPFTSSGTWGGTDAAQVTTSPGATAVTERGRQDPQPKRYATTNKTAAAGQQGSGVVAGGWLTFDTTHDPVVGMQVAISYVSVKNALGNLDAGASTWNVAAVAARASAAWNRQLSTITITGGSPAAQAEFYTALYHASLEPSLFSDANGQYIGFDYKVHTVQPGHAQYANFSGWDIYRSEVPLLATIDPAQAADMATSLVNDAAQGGALPKWPVANGYTGVMNGDAADPILADTYAFGARGFDGAAALAAMVRGADGSASLGQGWYVERPNAAAYIADGYVPNIGSDSISPVPNGASETLEYALDDFSISRLAQDLGQSPAARTFTKRSQNWANVFDTADGYIEPRDASGAFPSGPPVQTGAGFGQDGFQEGNAAQYTWMVPQNLAGLIQGLGGDQAAAARLDTFFTQLNAGPNEPYAWQGNEPGLDTPWFYDSVGQPSKTQALVREIASQLYSLTPGGEPGNDDLGAMSSWYVWAALGLYPQTPGVPMLVVGTPQFPQAVIHGAYGPLTVNASGAGNTYVHSLTVDGRNTGHTWIDLGHTHQLDFTLSSTPDTSWGSAAGDAPPSFGAGPVKFPPSTRASLSLSPGQVRLSPGSSTTVSVAADNTLGTSGPATVTWNATTPPGSSGLSVAPASGVQPIDVATLTAGTPVTVGTQDERLAVSPDGSQLWVANQGDGTASDVSLATDTVTHTITVGSAPFGVAVTPDQVYITNGGSSSVSVISAATDSVTATIPVGAGPQYVQFSPDGATAYVADFGAGGVTPIAVATGTPGAFIPTGSGAYAVGFSPDGTIAWVVDTNVNNVVPVTVATGSPGAAIEVGNVPDGVTVTG